MDEQPLDNEFIDILPEAAHEEGTPAEETPMEGIPADNPPTEQVKHQDKLVTDMWHNIHNKGLKKLTGDMIELSNGAVEQQLLRSSVEITSRVHIRITQTIQLKRSKPKNPPLPEVTEDKLRAKRNEALKMLEEINSQQRELLKQKRLSRLQSHSKHLQRSNVNEEEAARVKQLWQENRRLERKLRRRDQQLREAQLHEQEEEAKKAEEIAEDRRRKKREDIAQRLKELEKRKHEREQFIRSTDKSLQEQLHKKYLVDEMEENFRRKAEDERKLLQEQVLLKKKSTTVQINQLKEHQKKYKETVSRLKKDREQKLSEFKRKFVSESVSRYEDLQIAQILKREQEEEKKRQEEEQEYRHLYRDRIQSYDKQVRQKIPLPKLKEKTETAQSQTNTGLISQNKSLSFEELNRLGNSYLQVAKKRAKKRSGRSTQQSILVAVQPPRSVQPNYLKQMRQSNPSPEKYGDMNRLKRILHSSSQNPSYERITEAMSVADKMQSLAGRDTRKLTYCIQAKLQILKTIM